MSRITTSSASFSCARAAMRRACSSGLSVGSVSFVRVRSQCIPSPRTVQTPLPDQAGDGVGDEAVDRLPGGHGSANVPGSGRIRGDLEVDDAVVLALLTGIAGPGRNGQ